METIKTKEWSFTPNDEPRGYIDTWKLRELWFHTGTACNLRCPFCLEGSKPGDNRLGRIKLEDIKPYIAEAVEIGIEQFSFTGGEPFIVKDIIKILAYAAQYKPCLVLTNGSDVLLKRLAQIQTLSTAFPISFRISIDYPDCTAHEDGRGEGTFHDAWTSLQNLHELNFPISIARQMSNNENTDSVNKAYRQLMRKYQIPETTNIVAFPDFLAPGSDPRVPHITEHCMTQYQTEDSRNKFMCATSKMVIKTNGKMRVYACTLVDDDPNYDQGETLAEAIEVRSMLKHHRCYSCFSYGSSCSEL